MGPIKVADGRWRDVGSAAPPGPPFDRARDRTLGGLLASVPALAGTAIPASRA